MAFVKRARRIFDLASSIHWIRVYLASIPVTDDDTVSAHARQLRGEEFEVETARPREEWEHPGRNHRHGIDLGPVAVRVLVGELVADGREDRTFPRTDLFGENSGDKARCQSALASTASAA